jgi:O-antigen ligase
MAQTMGCAIVGFLPLLAYANELFLRKGYLEKNPTLIVWVALPVLAFLSGSLLRGLQDGIGRLWLSFGLSVGVAVLASSYFEEAAPTAFRYLISAWAQFLYVTAFAISIKHLRRLMLLTIAADCVLLLDCLLDGSLEHGRLILAGSNILGNPNELGLCLLVAIPQLMYLVYESHSWRRCVGLVAIVVAFVCLLKTASRGSFLAAIISGFILAVIVKQRTRVLTIGLVLVGVGAIWMPSQMLRRLSLTRYDSVSDLHLNRSDNEALQSEAERLSLLKTSLDIVALHPLAGVGPGQFATAVAEGAAQQGLTTRGLGPHNAFFQVATECGVPAFLLYTAVTLFILASNLGMYWRLQNEPALKDASVIALCLFTSTLAYTLCTLFTTAAYYNYVPVFAGMTAALRLAVRAANNSKALGLDSQRPSDAVAS